MAGKDGTARKKGHTDTTLFKKIFDNSPIGIALTTPDLRFISVNPSWISMTGYTEEELLQQTVRDITHPEHVSGDLEQMRHLASGAIPFYRTEKRYIRKNGSILWGRLMVTPLRDTSGKLMYFLTQVEDITVYRGAEQEIRESNRKLKEAQELAHLGFWNWDITTGAVEWSDEVYRIFGLSPATFSPQIDSIQALSPWPEDHERDKELIRRATQSHTPGSYEQRFLRPDGSVGYYYSTFEGRYDTSGNLIGMIGTVLDITGRKKADEALRESELRFRTLVNQIPVGIAITRKTETGKDLLYLNERFTEMTGYAMEGITSFDTGATHAYPDPEYRRSLTGMFPEIFSEAEKNLTGRPRVTRVTCRDGTTKDIEFRYTSLQSFGFWTMTDISERLRAEEQRETLIRELERKNAELERIMHTLSHDVKGPLITIRSFASLLENDSQSENFDILKRDIQRITSAADTMQALLSDVLEFSRVGRAIRHPSLVSFETIAKEAAGLLEGLLSERCVTVEIDSGLPGVRVDRVRIRELLVSLIENAAKFSGNQPDPRIWIGADTGGPDPVFFVRDNGSGIDPRYLTRIFNLFEKLDPVIPGTGIGLPIAKRIIEMHGGRIWAESEGTGKGTTIRFTLPMRDDIPGTG